MTEWGKTAVQDALDFATDTFEDTPGTNAAAVEAAITAFLADLPEELLLVVAERARYAKAEAAKQKMFSAFLRERERERLSEAHSSVQTTRNARVAEPLRDIVNAFSRGTAQEDDEGP